MGYCSVLTVQVAQHPTKIDSRSIVKKTQSHKHAFFFVNHFNLFPLSLPYLSIPLTSAASTPPLYNPSLPSYG